MYFVVVSLSSEIAYSKLSKIVNKPRKQVFYRFEVTFSSLEENDAFMAMLKRTWNASVLLEFTVGKCLASNGFV